MITILEILGVLVAFGLGIWWGLPGRYTQTAEDIERIMADGGRRRRRARRVFTPLTWMQRRASERGSQDRRSGGSGRERGFHIERPEERLRRERAEDR